jgi:hypothetical protein
MSDNLNIAAFIRSLETKNGIDHGKIEIPVTMFSTLSVSGATTLESTLSVSGATTLESTLSVSGATILCNDVQLCGAGNSLGFFGHTQSTILNVNRGSDTDTINDLINALVSYGLITRSDV